MNRRDLVNYGFAVLDIGVVLLNGGLLVYNVLNANYVIALFNGMGLMIGLVALNMMIQVIQRCKRIDQIQEKINEIDRMIQQMG